MANGIVDKERFAQLVRGGFPVNPVSGLEIVAENLNRLQAGMAMFGWDDPRFVSQAEAERMGWKIVRNSESVMTKVRDSLTGVVDTVTLFNARNVKGMPSLAEMLELSAVEFAGLQEVNSGVRIGPARARVREKKVVQDSAVEAGIEGAGERGVEGGAAVPGNAGLAETAKLSGRFVVRAPYWLDGMHNVEGLALEKSLNETIRSAGLERDAGAIARLMKEHERALLLDLEVVPFEWLLEDEHRRADLARPVGLLEGALVRDKEGAYRPKAGGVAVLEDKGDSLVVKGKSEQAYRGAIELAKAKGWTAIELSGKGAMLADAWLEAKMQGLEVVNYSPTKEDQKRLAESLAKEAALRAAKEGALQRTVEQSQEIVEVRPYVDAAGQAKTATVTYTVTQEGVGPMLFGDAKAAAAYFAGVPALKLPAVVRSVVRADGVTETDVMVAGTDAGKEPGSFVKSADAAVDREFSDELSEILSEKRVVGTAEKAVEHVTTGMYSGLIMKIEGDKVMQKVGRDPGQVVYHDIGKLSRVPKVGQVEDIRFGKDGIGVVAERGVGLEVG